MTERAKGQPRDKQQFSVKERRLMVMLIDAFFKSADFQVFLRNYPNKLDKTTNKLETE